MQNRVSKIVWVVFFLVVCVLSAFALAKYPGQEIVYVIFTILLNALLVNGFLKKKIFFDTFIGIFFWLGFWLKFSVRIAFMGGEFNEPIGNFSGTGADNDHALLVTSCGVLALLFASFIRKKYIFSYPAHDSQARFEAVYAFYRKHRTLILRLFIILIVIITFTNALLGIYQRGSVPRTILPFGLSGIYTWLVLFGLASFSAVLLDCEFRMNKNPYYVSIIGLFECFLSNVSMLSRGLVLNGGSLLIGGYENMKGRFIGSGMRYKVITLIVFGTFFLSSLIIVSNLRMYLLSDATPESLMPTLKDGRILFLDRWVGIEGVMAVSSHPGRGWDIWEKAWQEKYANYGTSLYDRTFIVSPYANTDMSKHHFISLPGTVAFFYYPGSFPFLFVSVLLLGFLAAGIEISVYKLGGANIILCALIAQVVAYRYAHFGYVPRQSYLLFGTIYLNLLIIYVSEKALSFWNNRSTNR